MLDDHGEPLALRADMTVPIARLVGDALRAPPSRRFASATSPTPTAPCARTAARCASSCRPGIELVGAPGAEGTAEALTVLSRAIEATGLRDFQIGLGDAALYPALLEAFGVPQDARERLLHELSSRDFVGLEREVRALGLGDDAVRTLSETPRLRGGAERARGAPAARSQTPSRACATSSRGSTRASPTRVIIDLGRAPRLGYYTGPMFEVYDPELGEPIGGGGRYDELLGRFGRPLPAVGFALGVDLLHAALAGEERGAAT